MPVTTKMSKRFLVRLVLISVFCLGCSAFFLYDGAVAWPKQRARTLGPWRAYEKMREELVQELGAQDVSDRAQRERWTEIAEEHGWDKTLPPERPKSELKIRGQFYFAAGLAVPGVCYIFFFLRDRRRWIEMSETGLRSSWGQQLDFGQIVLLDKKHWKKKGIARVRYEENGRRRTLTLDDWKYEPKTTLAILRGVEAHVGIDKIINGAPEPPPEEESKGESSETPAS
jgi:hypothetical protein